MGKRNPVSQWLGLRVSSQKQGFSDSVLKIGEHVNACIVVPNKNQTQYLCRGDSRITSTGGVGSLMSKGAVNARICLNLN